VASPGPGPCGPEADRAGPAHDSTAAHDSTTADDATADDTAAADDSTIDDWDYGTVTSTALSPSMRTLWGDSTAFCDAIASAIG
jgi:hypothetical protein